MITIVTQLIMLLISTRRAAAERTGRNHLASLPMPRLSVILFYWLVTSALWEAPVYGWLLLVSGWARRATFLWAVLPWLAICAIEKIAFDTAYFAQMLVGRLTGGFEEGFVVVQFPKDAHAAGGRSAHAARSAQIPEQPRSLDRALVIAAAFLVGAIRLRRYRGPL